MKKTSPDLPRFVVQHTNDDLFNFCVEINGAFQCYKSPYPPPMDTRFKRKIRKSTNQPLSVFEKSRNDLKIWDKGTWSIAKHKTKKDIEKAFIDGLSKNKLSFLLDGGRLQGRFIIHYDDNISALQLYKHKDKFAKEEDPLEMELRRSMNKWVPKFDPNKIEVPKPEKTSAPPPAEKKKPTVKGPAKKTAVVLKKKTTTPTPKKQKEEPPGTVNRTGIATFTTIIRSKQYDFALYTSLDEKSKDIICLITPPNDAPFIMQPASKAHWEIISSVSFDVARNEKLFESAILEFLQ